MELEFSRDISEEYSNIKFHENPWSGSRVVPWRWTDMFGIVQTGLTRLPTTHS